MATSGSPAFSANRNQLIIGALRLLRVIRAQGAEQLSGRLAADGERRLNGMIKRWQADPELHVWTTTEATLFPQAEQARYGVGDSATDHVTTTYAATTIGADEASGQTALTVSSITGISDNQNIGIQLDDGTIHWSTVNGSPSGSTVTIDDGLADTAASGNAVWAYTSNISRPLKIVDARRYDIESGNETPLTVEARLTYQSRVNKTQTGNINSMFYDPGRVTGYINLWQPPTVVTELVNFTWHRPLDSFLAAGDDADFPQEWIDPVEYNLALQWMPEFAVPAEVKDDIKMLAPVFLDQVAGFDREAESVTFAPDMDDYR